MKHPILQMLMIIGALSMFSLGPAIYNGFVSNREKPTKHRVKIVRMKFIPDQLVVKRGDTVVWENKDFVLHDVTDEKRNWGSGEFGQNESWSKVITKDESYFCNLHKVMKGTITIGN